MLKKRIKGRFHRCPCQKEQKKSSVLKCAAAVAGCLLIGKAHRKLHKKQ